MYVTVDDTSTVVVQYGTAPGPREGCTVVLLDTAQTEALVTLLAQPNGGITCDGTTFTALPAPPVAAAAVDPNAALMQAIQQATTLAELKAALTGQTLAAAAAGRAV